LGIVRRIVNPSGIVQRTLKPFRPGLGVGAEVFAAHGFQQIDRGLTRDLVLGTDVGEQKVRRFADELLSERGLDPR